MALNRKVKIGDVVQTRKGEQFLITGYYLGRTDSGHVTTRSLVTGEDNSFLAWFHDGTYNQFMSHVEGRESPMAGMS